MGIRNSFRYFTCVWCLPIAKSKKLTAKIDFNNFTPIFFLQPTFDFIMKSVWKESKIDPECCMLHQWVWRLHSKIPLHGEQEQDCCFNTRSCVNLTNTRKLGGRLEEAERNSALIMIMYRPVLTSSQGRARTKEFSWKYYNALQLTRDM